jgi:8-oxo-dGTP diphosphatase
MPRYPPCPKLTVDAVWVHRRQVLLIERGRPPFRKCWALPGGFVEAGESTERAVERELWEETGLKAQVARLVGVYSDPGRDPRGPTVTIAYAMKGQFGPARGGDDAGAAHWWSIDALPPLAFDHSRIVGDALRGIGRGPRPASVRSRRSD